MKHQEEVWNGNCLVTSYLNAGYFSTWEGQQAIVLHPATLAPQYTAFHFTSTLFQCIWTKLFIPCILHVLQCVMVNLHLWTNKLTLRFSGPSSTIKALLTYPAKYHICTPYSPHYLMKHPFPFDQKLVKHFTSYSLCRPLKGNRIPHMYSLRKPFGNPNRIYLC